MKIVFVIGPTSSGKTDYAMSKAIKNQGAIINIDSAQVYKEIKIACGAPTKEDLLLVPHYLFNYVSASQEYNIGIYINDLYNILDYCNNKYPYVYITGGSAMYIYCVLNGLYDIPKITDENKAKVDADYQNYGIDYIYNILLSKFNNIHDHITEFNKRKILRLYSIFLQTGKIDGFSRGLNIRERHGEVKIKRILPSKDIVYRKCQDRVFDLLDKGALEEAKKNLDNYDLMNSSAKKILLFAELNEYLNNNLSYQDMISKSQFKTRRYAKHQYTWFSKGGKIN